MNQVYDSAVVEEVQKRAREKALRALSSIKLEKVNKLDVITDSLIIMVPGLVCGLITKNFSTLSVFPVRSYLYNSYEGLPAPEDRPPLYDEDGCLLRPPYADELKPSIIDQHGTCGIAID